MAARPASARAPGWAGGGVSVSGGGGGAAGASVWMGAGGGGTAVWARADADSAAKPAAGQAARTKDGDRNDCVGGSMSSMLLLAGIVLEVRDITVTTPKLLRGASF